MTSHESFDGNELARVAVVGSRSFIARDLLHAAGERGIPSIFLDKDSLGSIDMSGLDCVYLVLGRSHPTPDEDEAETERLSAFLSNPRPPKRAVYIGSLRPTMGKQRCESMIAKHAYTPEIFVVRPPAVFGPNQDQDSMMLIPSIARWDGEVSLRTPDVLTRFISVRDLTDYLLNFSDLGWYDIPRCQVSDSSFDIPGTFSARPRDIRELYRTFKGLRKHR